jgi:oxygen-dependent protoporphyrinogen oxidase
MQDIIDALEKRLIFQGVSIQKEVDFKFDMEPTTATVIATSARSAAQILKEAHPVTSRLLAKIEMASLMTVTTFWKSSSSPYKGFGCLIPRSDGLRTLGILINSSIFPGRDQTYSETFIFGGATDPAVLDLSDAEVKDLIQIERQRIFGVQDHLREAFITRWPAALPHYTVDLEEILAEISLPDNIYLHGNYLDGIGLTKILTCSKTLAQEIKRKHG